MNRDFIQYSYFFLFLIVIEVQAQALEKHVRDREQLQEFHNAGAAPLGIVKAGLS